MEQCAYLTVDCVY